LPAAYSDLLSLVFATPADAFAAFALGVDGQIPERVEGAVARLDQE
jgi:hypothetical protein